MQHRNTMDTIDELNPISCSWVWRRILKRATGFRLKDPLANRRADRIYGREEKVGNGNEDEDEQEDDEEREDVAVDE